MSDPSIADPFGRIADEFVEEFRQGRRPSVEEFASRYPEYAAEIRDILPALVLMERAKSVGGSIDGEPPCDQDSAAFVGRELGDYRILREVGRGGMGIVYEAEQISLGRRVALKILPRQVSLDSKQRRRFDREARAAARLHHTNIVPVFGVGEQDGLCYYVMQYIRGLGLDKVLDELKRIAQASPASGAASRGELRISRRPHDSAAQVAEAILSGNFDRQTQTEGEHTPDSSVVSDRVLSGSSSPIAALPAESFTVADSSFPAESGREESTSAPQPSITYWHSVAQIGAQASEALEYAHEQGITHRDVKPSNLLLDLHGTIWVTDFGLAKSDDQHNLTHSGDILGTIRYLPPEAFDGRSDARSDVYSLGLTLYEMLTLRPAFDEVDRRILVKRVTTGEPPRVERVAADVPRDLATIVHKAIERDPADRYQSARQLADDLHRFLRDEPILARRASLLEQARRWSRHNRGLAAAVVSIAALLLIIAVGASVAAIYYRQQEESQRQLRQQADLLASRNQNLADEKHRALVSAIDTSQKLDTARARAEEQEEVTRQNLYYAQMAVAHQSWQGHRGMLRTQLLLDDWRPQPGKKDLRGWEWYYIQALCHREQAALAGHTDAVTCVAFSRDGTKIVSAARDGAVRIWMESDRRCARVLEGHAGQVYAVDWNSSGSLVASAGDDGVIVWDAATGDKVQEIPSDKPVFAVAFSPDDRLLARGMRQGPLELWATGTWTRVNALEGHRADIYTETVSFHPQGTLLAAPAGRHVIVWNVGSGERMQILEGHTGYVQAAVFSPDGTRLASTSRDATIRIWDVDTGQPLAVLTGHTHGIASVAWHPDGSKLASAAWDGSCRVWNLETKTEIGLPRGHARHVFSVAWHPQGNLLATSGDDNLVKLWGLSHSQESVVLAENGRNIRSLVFARDGLTVASGDIDGSIGCWDAASGASQDRVDTGRGPINRLAFHPSDGRVAAACGDGSIVVWDRERRQLHNLGQHKRGAASVVWDASGSRILSAGLDQAIVLWDAETAAQLDTLPSPAQMILAASLRADGSQLAAGCGNGSLWLLDIPGKTTRSLPGHSGRIVDVAYHPDGRQVATAGDDHLVRIWDTRLGKELQVLSGHSEVVAAVAYSPDGQRLLSADARGTIKLWDVSTGVETLTVRGNIGELRTACWSPDGQQICASSDDQILMWDAKAGYTLEREINHTPGK